MPNYLTIVLLSCYNINNQNIASVSFQWFITFLWKGLKDQSMMNKTLFLLLVLQQKKTFVVEEHCLVYCICYVLCSQCCLSLQLKSPTKLYCHFNCYLSFLNCCDREPQVINSKSLKINTLHITLIPFR